MAAQSTSNTGIQSTDVPQVNDSTTVQEQGADNLPSTVTQKNLQPNSSDVNSLKTQNLSVKYGPKTTPPVKSSSATIMSIVLVAVILIAAAALFIASLRVKEEAKPTIAPGAEDAGALGTAKKKRFKKNKNK